MPWRDDAHSPGIDGPQDVWPVASRMVDVYRGGGGIGGFGGYYSGLQHKGPSAPYLQFSAGGSKVT